MTNSFSSYKLPHPFIFRVEGKDAIRYLHARLTNDIKKLPIGYSCLAAALTPQGKTEGIFACLREGESSYLLQCDGGEAESVQSALKRYIVADRVSVEIVQNGETIFHCSPTIASQIRDVAGISPQVSTHLIPQNPCSILAIIPRNRIGSDGFDLWVARSDSENSDRNKFFADSTPFTDVDFEKLRYLSGSPVFPQELNQDHLLTEAPVDGIVGNNKGCYVGQEVIERIASRGATPRLLARFSCNAPHSLPSGVSLNAIQDDGTREKVGEVCSSMITEGGTLGFASIKRQVDPSTPLFIGDYSATFSWVSGGIQSEVLHD
jgi:folate-binding protein YgfZ